MPIIDAIDSVRQLPYLDPADDIQRDVNPRRVDDIWRQRQHLAQLRLRNQRRQQLGLTVLPERGPT